MLRSLAKKLLAAIAVTGIVVGNVALVARLLGYVGFDAAMITAVVCGITATLTGGAYLVMHLSEVHKNLSSIRAYLERSSFL
jgi:hypothetical protein